MYTDYKFGYIKRDVNNFITEASSSYYEGDYQLNEKGQLQYTRFDVLKIVIYTSKNFGQIKNDDELRSYLNKELVKDITRISRS